MRRGKPVNARNSWLNLAFATLRPSPVAYAVDDGGGIGVIACGW